MNHNDTPGFTDYAQHGIKLQQLLRKIDDYCLERNWEMAYKVGISAVVEARMLAVSIKGVAETEVLNEQRRLDGNDT